MGTVPRETWTVPVRFTGVEASAVETHMNTQPVSEADRWLKAGRQALVSGTLASTFSTAVLAWQGYSRYRKPAAPDECDEPLAVGR